MNMTPTPILYVLGSIMCCVLILFGWMGEGGYIHKASLILGGVYLGYLITEALNYVDTEEVGA